MNLPNLDFQITLQTKFSFFLTSSYLFITLFKPDSSNKNHKETIGTRKSPENAKNKLKTNDNYSPKVVKSG